MLKLKTMSDIKYKIRVKMRKYKDMRFFSQLDLVRVFERALRRTGLPLYFTKGFNPRVKMSFGNALKLGLEGEISVVFYFIKNIAVYELKSALSLQLPDGLDILEITSL